MTKEPADALVLFGATGDLAYKQIFPALQAMVKHKKLNVPIVAAGREGRTLDELRARVRDSLEHHPLGLDKAAFDTLARLLRYASIDYNDLNSTLQIKRALGGAERPLHYLAIPPSAFENTVRGLEQAGCTVNARVALEKPFGRDLKSSRELNEILYAAFAEEAIFRIDHYLGKEPIMNLAYFRFANPFVEPLWNRDHVSAVHISMEESFGVGSRGRFYEETGAIRDVLQNHLLQATAILAMDGPVGQDTESFRDEKARVLKAITPLDPAHIVRGQYRGYRQERGVAPDSTVETFAAVELHVETWRWAGVPFYIRTGKRLAATKTEIVVDMKPPARDLYREHVTCANYVRFRLGPDNAIALGIRVMQPGTELPAITGKQEELIASEDTQQEMLPYERLLTEALRGDQMLFAREDAIEAQWRIVDPVLGNVVPVHLYEPGSAGPDQADRIGHCISRNANGARGRLAS